SGARYTPPSFVITDLVSPVSRLATVTTTPGSTPPDSSVTVPSMMPLIACPWAAAIEARERTSRTAATPRNMWKSSGLVQIVSIACLFLEGRWKSVVGPPEGGPYVRWEISFATRDGTPEGP